MPTATLAQESAPALAPVSPERAHFEDHGWVLLHGRLDPGRVRRYREGIDRAVAGPYAVQHLGPSRRIERMIMMDTTFVEFLMLPGILDTYTEIAGAAAVLKNCWALINPPHPQRHDPEVVAQRRRDRHALGWHRGSLPKWAIYADEARPGMHHFPYLNFFTYLSDVGPERGGTNVLDGSHKVPGEYDEVVKRCPAIEIEARAGDILLFSESTMHAGATCFGEDTRYAMAYTFIPSFYSNAQNCGVPPWFYQNFDNADLRGVLGAWRGVISPQRFGLTSRYAYDFTTRTPLAKEK